MYIIYLNTVHGVYIPHTPFIITQSLVITSEKQNVANVTVYIYILFYLQHNIK